MIHSKYDSPSIVSYFWGRYVFLHNVMHLTSRTLSSTSVSLAEVPILAKTLLAKTVSETGLSWIF